MKSINMRKTLSIILTSLLMLCIGVNANAQISLGGLKNAVKKTAGKAITNTAGKAASNTAGTVTATVNETVGETTEAPAQNIVQEAAPDESELFPVHNVPCPVFMAKDDDWQHTMIREYIDHIGYVTNSTEIGVMRDSLRARAQEDSLEVARLKPLFNKLSGDSYKAYNELQKELDRYDTFLRCLGDYTTRMNFEGRIDLEKGTANIDRISVRLEKTTVYVMWDQSDGKEYFYSLSGDKCFLEDEDMEYVNHDIRRYFYVEYFLSGLTDREFREVSQKADICFSCLRMAKDHNSVDNIEYQPYPKGGPLNSLAGKALASAKQSDSYTDAVAVVIDADSWTIDYDAIGNPIRRKAGGWVIKNTKYGKKAYRAQFSEDYMGGGKYGEIKLYGIGGGQHYVK